MTDTKILVLHVKKGYEERERFMRKVLGSAGLDFEFILDGDLDDLTPEVLDRYFTGEMKQVAPYTSCTMKHLLACEYVLNHRLPGALVLEDDMMLYKNFRKVFAECMEEMERDHIENPLINFEDSALRFVPGSQRRKGKHLYRATRDRFAGCYYLSYGAAEQIMNYVREHKCDQISDVFHKSLITRIGLPYYWCHPCIATQGTHNGLFPSSLNEQSARKQRYRANTWKLKLAYKKLIYLFR